MAAAYNAGAEYQQMEKRSSLKTTWTNLPSSFLRETRYYILRTGKFIPAV
jgi:hypothetical protein